MNIDNSISVIHSVLEQANITWVYAAFVIIPAAAFL